MSPMLHLASLATYTPPFLLGAMGNQRATLVCFVICFVANWSQHLGFDPLPFVTRWNHYYCYGALPWTPLYHAYHHLPFIKTGNFGNTTMLFDYVYGTLQSESLYHIEHGHMMPKVAEHFENPEKLDRILHSMLNDTNPSKNRLDLNKNGYDFSTEFFSLDYM